MVVPALLKNAALNRRNNITVLNAALSNDVQFVGFSLENLNNLGMASFKVKKDTSFSVLSCPLKFIFESQKIHTAELIKIDIEGNEFDVLMNFPFDKYEIKNILLEYNSLSKKTLQELADFFYLRGFIMQNIKGKQVNNILEGIPENNLWLVNRHYNYLH